MFSGLIKALLSPTMLKPLINGVLIVAVSIWGYYQAYDNGFNAAKLEQTQAQNAALSQQISQLGEQINAANKASLELSQNIGKYQSIGDQTTYELQQLLAQDAHRRRDCRYPADSMRQLAEARTRAVQAVTGGIDSTLSVPAAAATKQQ
nr:MAG TPA: Protein of unknown function (DUF2570) [Caudoviricetes sp.]